MNGAGYVAVCAGDIDCLERLALRGRQVADEQGCPMKLVLFPGMQKKCMENGRLLEAVFGCARNLDAEMKVYYTDRPLDKLIAERAACFVMSAGEKMTGEMRRRMPEKRLIVMEERAIYNGEDRQAGADFRDAGVFPEGSGEPQKSAGYSDGEMDADADAGHAFGAGRAD